MNVCVHDYVHVHVKILECFILETVVQDSAICVVVFCNLILH